MAQQHGGGGWLTALGVCLLLAALPVASLGRRVEVLGAASFVLAAVMCVVALVLLALAERARRRRDAVP